MTIIPNVEHISHLSDIELENLKRIVEDEIKNRNIKIILSKFHAGLVEIFSETTADEILKNTVEAQKVPIVYEGCKTYFELSCRILTDKNAWNLTRELDEDDDIYDYLAAEDIEFYDILEDDMEEEELKDILSSNGWFMTDNGTAFKIELNNK